MARFFNRQEVESIYDSVRKRRVVIFQRQDGTFGFVEDRYSDDPYEQCWIEQTGYSESFCDTLETVRREVFGRVRWLAEQQ